MFRLQIVNTTDVFILLWQFPKPRAPLNVLPCDRADPYVVDEMGSKLNGGNPFQYVMPSCPLPHLDVLIGYAG